MEYCAQCGKAADREGKFCRWCGAQYRPPRPSPKIDSPLTRPRPKANPGRKWTVLLVVVIAVGVIGLILTGTESSRPTASSGSPVATQAMSESSQTADTFVDDHRFHWILNPLTGHSSDVSHGYTVAFLSLHHTEISDNSGLIIQGIIAGMDQQMVILRDANNPNTLAACVMKRGEMEWLTTHSEGESLALYGEYAGPSPYPIADVEGMPMLTECVEVTQRGHVITPDSRPPRTGRKH